MVKGHPTMLYCIAKNNNISLPTFQHYLQNFDDVVIQLSDYYSTDEHELTRDHIKSIFNIMIYGGGFSTWVKQMNKDGIELKVTTQHQFVTDFKNECLLLMNTVYDNNTAIANKVRGKCENEYELKSRVMSYFCGTIENEILHLAYKFLVKNNAIVAKKNVCLEYDGLCFKRPQFVNLDELLISLNKHIIDKTGLEITFSFKDYSPKHVIQSIIDKRNGIVDESISKLDDEKTYENVKLQFETQHCKIIKRNLFIKKDNDDITMMSRTHLTNVYENKYYDKPCFDKNGELTKIDKEGFIGHWLQDANMNEYDDIGMFPNKDKCPKNIFNMWIPFEMELKTDEYEKHDEGLQIILNHIKILCNHDEIVYDYFVKWIAQMIQYPDVKTIMPILISKEGSGKGTLMVLFKNMFGRNKYFETTDPSRDVWGNFNSKMKDSFLVNLDELSKKDLLDSIGKVKGLITNEALTINEKGVSQYSINSYHRFIVTTNSDDPIPTSEGDRRNLIIKSSDEKKGDSDYFKKLYALLDDENVIRTCYDYFKSIEDMDNFGSIPLPQTEYQNNLKELSKSPIDLWLESFTRENDDKIEVEMLGSEALNLFNKWKTENDVKYEITSQKLGVRILNMKISGVYKGNHTKKGETKLYKIDELKKHYGLGLLINY
jgi:hypothetical protein